MSVSPESIPLFWQVIGYIGGAVFYGRFYVQWIVSELRKKSVIPIVFWYMSAVGTLLLFAYGVAVRSPVGTLSHSFNMVIYGRNLVHIWRERGRLNRASYWLVHAVMALTVSVSVGFLAWTWLREFHAANLQEEASIAAHWFWIGVGVAGQVCFTARFLVQWLLTEIKRRSVVPLAFWYLSVGGSSLQAASFFYRWWVQGHAGELLYMLGLLATLFVYLRNIILIHRHRLEKVLK